MNHRTKGRHHNTWWAFTLVGHRSLIRRVGWSVLTDRFVYQARRSQWTSPAKRKLGAWLDLFIKISNHKHTLSEFVFIYTSILSLPVVSFVFFLVDRQENRKMYTKELFSSLLSRAQSASLFFFFFSIERERERLSLIFVQVLTH